MENHMHGTTILSVRKGDEVAIGGDGQVTLGHTVMKASARKVRKLYNDSVLAGFAGGTADAFTLLELFESKLQKHQGKLLLSAIELAKEWRSDRVLRRLEAMLIVADKDNTLILTGTVMCSILKKGLRPLARGGPYAQAAARALLQNTDLSPKEIVEKALKIAGDICIYTNQSHTIETLEKAKS